MPGRLDIAAPEGGEREQFAQGIAIGEALPRQRAVFLLERLRIIAVDAQNGRVDLSHFLERLIVSRVGDEGVICRDGGDRIMACDLIDGAKTRERGVSLWPRPRQRLESGFGLTGFAVGR